MTNDNYQPKIKVKRSNAGLGLFADEEIPRDQLVVEYTGDRLTGDQADERGGKYLFEVTNDLVIDGKGRHNIARYINHSCRPNAYAEHDVEEGRIYIRAKRKIKAGEEITYSYGKEYVDDIISQIGCRCLKCLPSGKKVIKAG